MEQWVGGVDVGGDWREGVDASIMVERTCRWWFRRWWKRRAAGSTVVMELVAKFDSSGWVT